VLRLPVDVQVPLTGSYNSELARRAVKPNPPAARTIPPGNKVAV
jgi:hypothetical protein